MRAVRSRNANRRRELAGAFALLILGGVPPASAGSRDGRWAIDAACVPVGCFPGDAPGFPVEIQVPGAYVLTSDLSVAALPQPETQTAIVVASAAVDLDLGGFALRGPTTCDASCAPVSILGVGIVGQGPAHGLRVHDGSIVGFGGSAVQLYGDLAALARLRIRHNGAGAIQAFGLAPRLEELVVSHNGGIGIYIALAAGSVRDSSVSDSPDAGIVTGPAALVETNVVTDANINASMIDVGAGSRVASNVTLSGFYGIVAQAGSLIYGNYSFNSVLWQLALNSGCAYTANNLYNASNLNVSGGLSLSQNLCDISNC